jgi:GAF domain-containing protein
MLAEMLKADLGVIGETVDDGAALSLSVAAAPCAQTPDGPATLHVPNRPEDSMAAYALRSQEVVVAADLGAESRFTDASLVSLGVISAMAIPLRLGGKPFGALAICCKQPREFTPSEVRCAAAVGESLGSLIARLDAVHRQALDATHKEEADGTAAGDKRSGRRYRYGYRQRIAPVLDRRPPSEKDFFEVECHDISSGGFSFFLERPPQFERLVAAIGQDRTLNHLIAKVVRVAEVRRNGGAAYLVGCRFVKRVQLSP